VRSAKCRVKDIAQLTAGTVSDRFQDEDGTWRDDCQEEIELQVSLNRILFDMRKRKYNLVKKLIICDTRGMV
jgi:uncharacterized protein YjaG (DUF416 family)